MLINIWPQDKYNIQMNCLCGKEQIDVGRISFNVRPRDSKIDYEGKASLIRDQYLFSREMITCRVHR